MALGTRRLAVVDLSEHGHQPMASPDGRYVLAYNGEIYNFGDLRARARGRRASLPGLVGHRGPRARRAALGPAREPCVRCNGMFALALWDRRSAGCTWRATASARSRCTTAGRAAAFLFGSELKALRAHPRLRAPRSTATPWRCTSATTACPPRTRSTGASPSCRPASIVTFEQRTTPGTAPAPEPTGRCAAVAEAGDRAPRRRRPRTALDELDAVLARRGGHPHARRRGPRGVPVGRDRLVAGRGADAGPDTRPR